MTGTVHYVDAGYNIVAMPRPETIKESGEGTTALGGNGDTEIAKPQAAE